MTESWTIEVCSCGAYVAETFEYLHTGEGHDGGKRVEVVRKARLEEAWEAAHDFLDASVPTGYSNIDRRAYDAAWARLRDALMGTPDA